MDDFLFAGWKNGFRAIGRNITLFLLTAILLLPAHLLGHRIPHLVAAAGGSEFRILKLALWAIPVSVYSALIQAPFLVATYRYLGLGPGADRKLLAQTSRLGGFFLASLGLAAFFLAPMVLILLAPALHHHAPTWLIVAVFLSGLVLVLAALIAYVRFVLVLPGTAMGGPEPWQSSWRATRGHWWTIAATSFICQLPFSVLASALYFIAKRMAGTASVLLASEGGSLVGTVGIACGAALLSAFHQAYASPTPDFDFGRGEGDPAGPAGTR